MIEWNKLDPHLRKSESLSGFKIDTLKFIPPSSNYVFNCYDLRGVCLTTRLKLGLSHLKEHKFKYGLQDTLNVVVVEIM